MSELKDIADEIHELRKEGVSVTVYVDQDTVTLRLGDDEKHQLHTLVETLKAQNDLIAEAVLHLRPAPTPRWFAPFLYWILIIVIALNVGLWIGYR